MMPGRSRTHIVLIPSYNSGPNVIDVVRAARSQWEPVWVSVDGSTDGSGEALAQMALTDPGLAVFLLPENRGKGAALLHGLREAEAKGFTHVLTMDADGQHPVQCITKFMGVSLANPAAAILAVPVFDASAPLLRVRGRRISNWWANLETLWIGIGDLLCGFRVYPIQRLRPIMEASDWMRRFDVDAEAAVRLSWQGVRIINLPAPVRYLTHEEGGISHFHYFRDNAVLTWMHIRLMFAFLGRLPLLVARRIRSCRH